MANNSARNVYLNIVWRNHPDALEFIEGVGESYSYNAGECITAQGEVGRSMFLILEGSVKVVRSTRGGNRQIGRLEKHRSFGEVSLLTGAPRMANVIAETPVRVLKIAYDNLEKLALENPRLALSIYRILAESLALSLQHVGEMLTPQKKEV